MQNLSTLPARSFSAPPRKASEVGFRGGGLHTYSVMPKAKRSRKLKRAADAVPSRTARRVRQPRRLTGTSPLHFIGLLYARRGWQGAALVLLVVGGYLPVLSAGFIWDDALILHSEVLRHPDGLWSIWFDPRQIAHEVHYWPVVYSSFWLENLLWGHNPVGYHVVNLLLHTINVLLVWWLMRRLAVAGAWLVAGVFALHPLHVESVAWVIERKDLLSGLFFLAAAAVYVGDYGRRTRGAYLLTATCLVLGMLSKSIVVTLPLSLWLLHWWKQGRVSVAQSLRLVPLLLLALAIAGADMYYFYSTGSVIGLDYTWLERLLIAARAVLFYLDKIIWPTQLAIVYPYWDPSLDNPVNWLCAAAILLLIGALWVSRRRIGRGPMCGLLFFIITLSPVLGFIEHSFMAFSLVADRFQYLAGIGVIAPLVAGAWLYLPKCCGAWVHFAWWSAWQQRIGAVLSVSVLLILASITWQQSTLYRHDGRFFQHIIDHNPSARDAHKNLGGWLSQQGRKAEALTAYRIAAEQQPQSAVDQHNLGVALFRMRKPLEALSQFQLALELDEDFSASRTNRDFLLQQLQSAPLPPSFPKPSSPARPSL